MEHLLIQPPFLLTFPILYKCARVEGGEGISYLKLNFGIVGITVIQEG